MPICAVCNLDGQFRSSRVHDGGWECEAALAAVGRPWLAELLHLGRRNVLRGFRTQDEALAQVREWRVHSWGRNWALWHHGGPPKNVNGGMQ